MVGVFAAALGLQLLRESLALGDELLRCSVVECVESLVEFHDDIVRCVTGDRGGHCDPVHPIRIGCSGWNYSHWRDGVFYPARCPPRRWLPYYAEHFDTVEVNSSFYRLPRR